MSTAEEEINKKSESRVVQVQHGNCLPTNAYEWPSGDFLWELCRTVDREHMNKIDCEYSTAISELWQASARWALLKKFASGEKSNVSEPSVTSPLIPDNVDVIQSLWYNTVKRILVNSKIEIADKIIGSSIEKNSDHSVQSSNFDEEISDCHKDLADFFINRCCKSNSQQLQWSIMSCPRGVQFQLHAHPNLELIYCIRGTLYEVRMNGEPPMRKFEESKIENGGKGGINGPSLTNVSRSWSFGTLHAGHWLVNEVGSIHKSFTSSRADGGCDLLVLWSGSHANISDPPIVPNIDNAVNVMDRKIQQEITSNSSCCSNATYNAIAGTFLPNDEK